MNKFITPLLLVVLIFHSCKKGAKSSHSDEDSNHMHWSYEGETSPKHWAEIEKESTCNSHKQSPIDIIEINAITDSINGNDLVFQYNPKTKINGVRNNGHSIQFDFEAGDSIRYNEKTYHLKQIHFHEPSEHKINGKIYPIEIHLVHMSNLNNITVLSALGEEGLESQLFKFLESFLPLEMGEEKEIHKAIDLTTLFPKTDEYFSYSGSLTTPPCSENVNWIVFKDPIKLSSAEILELRDNMPMNNYREEQPLHGRKVYLNSIKN